MATFALFITPRLRAFLETICHEKLDSEKVQLAFKALRGFELLETAILDQTYTSTEEDEVVEESLKAFAQVFQSLWD